MELSVPSFLHLTQRAIAPFGIHYRVMYTSTKTFSSAARRSPPQGGTKGTGSEATCSKVRDECILTSNLFTDGETRTLTHTSTRI